MTSYQQNIVEIVTQAAIHLQNGSERIGTGLYDENGQLVLDNGASHYADEIALIGAMVDCTVNPVPGAMFQCDSASATAIAMSLDGRYMFVMVGHQFENASVEKFLADLQEMLPSNAFTH